MTQQKEHSLAKTSLMGISPSYQVIILLNVILIGILFGGYLVLDNLKVLRDDASVINNLGVIRGSIQLVSKREINHLSSVI